MVPGKKKQNTEGDNTAKAETKGKHQAPEDNKSVSRSVFEGDMKPEERVIVEKYRGLTRRLSRSLTRFWNIPDDTIEVGATCITKKGAITHIVHDMQGEDLQIYAEELFKYKDPSEVTGISVIRKVYELRKDELTKLFRDRFHLNTDFKVEFVDRIGKRCLSTRASGLSSQLQRKRTQLMKYLNKSSAESQLMDYLHAQMNGDGNGIKINIEDGNETVEKSKESNWSVDLSVSTPGAGPALSVQDSNQTKERMACIAEERETSTSQSTKL